jgi:transposase-like protein
LPGWCKQAAIDAGERPGTTTSDAQRIKALEAEVDELRRANEILLAASSFFARELDPRLPWQFSSSTMIVTGSESGPDWHGTPRALAHFH